jgi:gliding motility-associated-like protein
LPLLTLNGSSGNVQWYETSGGPIPGATGLTYQTTVSGSYWAELTQGGCPDSTSTVIVTIHPLPIPSFTFVDTACVKSTVITFNNTSTAPDGANMSYLWSFSDGTTQTITDAVKNFLRTGIYTVKLDVTTEFGCKATSPLETVNILPNGVPDFTWDSICTGKPVKFTNLSNENGTALARYWWDFNNGDPISNVKDPAPVFYNMDPTQLAVTLKMTTLGCEADTQTVTKTIQVNKQAAGITYKGSTVPQGSSRWIHVRDTIGNIYNWRPQLQLSSYTTRYTEFFAISDDVTYYIDITDIHTCVTTDTITMLVLKKPGYYLPTAFTPNGDGLNDIVRPYLVGMKALKSFSIYNRWGNLLFYSATAGEGWDGKTRNVTQNAGVYVWVLEFYDSNNKLVKEKGTITLIR